MRAADWLLDVAEATPDGGLRWYRGADTDGVHAEGRLTALHLLGSVRRICISGTCERAIFTRVVLLSACTCAYKRCGSDIRSPV